MMLENIDQSESHSINIARGCYLYMNYSCMVVGPTNCVIGGRDSVIVRRVIDLGTGSIRNRSNPISGRIIIHTGHDTKRWRGEERRVEDEKDD